MDPARLILDIAVGITKTAKSAVANQEECKLLAELAQQTTPFARQLENREVDDPMLEQALDLILDAMREAQSAVESCCNSTFFSGMFLASKHNWKLQEAARKLEFALAQLPLASAGMTAEMQSELGSLKEELRRARFDQAAAASHQMRTLKTEMEHAFNENRQGTKEMRTMIEDMLKQHSASVEERMQDLAVLKRFAEEARRNKETQDEFELNQLMEVIADSIKATEPGLSSGQSSQQLDVERHLCCPISQERMVDPVILKDSGVTYDRSAIVEWMKRGKKFDPMTRIEIKSGELIPNRAIKGILQELSKVAEKQQTVDLSENWSLELEPGLYEGNGTLAGKDETLMVAFLVWALGPDGRVDGYFKFNDEPTAVPAKIERPICDGAWDAQKGVVTFTDTEDFYTCSIETISGCFWSAFSVKGGVQLQSRTGLFLKTRLSTFHISLQSRFSLCILFVHASSNWTERFVPTARSAKTSLFWCWKAISISADG